MEEKTNGAEATVKSGRKHAFTVLYKSAIEDKRLPLDARGLLAIMVGLPEGWEFSVKGLSAYVGVSKDTIRRLLNKLEEVGYLVREQTHDESGHFSRNTYLLQDEAPPLSGNTDNGETRQREKPSSGFPTQIKNKRNKEEKKQTPIIPREVMAKIDEYCGEDAELKAALVGFAENRTVALKKPVKTAYNAGLIGKELDKLSGGSRAVKIALLEKATRNNWQGIYPLDPDEMPKVEKRSEPHEERDGGYWD